MDNLSLNFTLTRNVATTQSIKFTGQTKLNEALLGELSSLNQLSAGATITFATTDAQYCGAAGFASPIPQENGLRINSSMIISNMFTNCFAKVKRIEITGAIIPASMDAANLLAGAPVMVGEIYQAGLCLSRRQAITFQPDTTFLNIAGAGNQNQQFSRYYWEGDTVFSGFTNWIVRLQGATFATSSASCVVFFFDEVLPMSQYHVELAKIMTYGNPCTMPVPSELSI